MALGHKITAVVLTYNHALAIDETLDSLLNQTIEGYEVLVSDDCSTDGTWERICQRAARDPRIRPLRTPRNLGMPGNANFAIAHSDRPYIALLHHDDICRPALLERWAEVLERHAAVGFVFNAYGRYPDGQILGEVLDGEVLDGARLLERYLLRRWGCIVRGTAMIRRSAWVEVGGLREEYGLLADVDLWMRLAMRGPVGYVPEPLLLVRHIRPAYYPAIYRGSPSTFWERQRLLYAIHATNTCAWSRRLGGWRGRWWRWRFRVRLGLDIAKWITYAWAKRRWAMLDTAFLATLPCEPRPARWYRTLSLQLARRLQLIRSGDSTHVA